MDQLCHILEEDADESNIDANQEIVDREEEHKREEEEEHEEKIAAEEEQVDEADEKEEDFAEDEEEDDVGGREEEEEDGVGDLDQRARPGSVGSKQLFGGQRRLHRGPLAETGRCLSGAQGLEFG